MVEFSERSVVLCLLFIVYLCPYESIAGTNNNLDRNKKKLEEIEETNEAQHEQELDKIYASSKANTFLTYDKCIQRLKCPINRKEECSEECRAGNTEEEMEEHEELTRDEHRTSLNKGPKQKYEGINVNSKKQRSSSKSDL